MGGPEYLIFGDSIFLFNSPDSHSLRAECIDHPWDATGVLIDSVDGILIEQWFFQPRQFEVVLDIGGGLLFGQSRKMVLKRDPLIERLKHGDKQSFPQMGLTDEYKQCRV